MSKTKILCTGGGGFLLSNFIRKILPENKDYSVVTIDTIKHPKILNTLYSNKGQIFYIGNVIDQHFINTIFEIEQPNIIIHAAEEQIKKSNCSNNDIINTNILGTQTIIDASIKYNVNKLIYISTDKVYGSLNSESDPKWNEEDNIDPKSIYASTKLSGELLLKASKLNYNILRISNVYGPRQSRKYLIPYIIGNILENKSIEIYGEGKEVRDWLHVQDFCSAVKTIIESGENNTIYNVGSNQEFSNLEVFHHICNLMEQGHNLLKFIPNTSDNNFRYAVNSSKLRKLNWKPEFKLKSGLEHTVNFFIGNKWILKE